MGIVRAFPGRPLACRLSSGRSSGVEHNLAKVGVGRSNRLSRSLFSQCFTTVVRMHFGMRVLARAGGADCKIFEKFITLSRRAEGLDVYLIHRNSLQF